MNGNTLVSIGNRIRTNASREDLGSYTQTRSVGHLSGALTISRRRREWCVVDTACAASRYGRERERIVSDAPKAGVLTRSDAVAPQSYRSFWRPNRLRCQAAAQLRISHTTCIYLEQSFPDMPRPDLRQHLRVFISADLVDGTAYKVRHPSPAFAGTRAWPDRFRGFFQDFPQRFSDKIDEARRTENSLPVVLQRPRVWKINGDELLMTDFVYPRSVGGFRHLTIAVRTVAQVVKDYDRELLAEGMGLRGTIWTAGFPIRNRILRIGQGQDIPIVTLRRRVPDFDTGVVADASTTVLDFLGPEMDLGFRLAAVTPAGRISCSLDLAWLLTHDPDSAMYVFHVGWRRMKGVANGQPYPLLWLESRPDPPARHPWDATDPEASPETRALLSNPQNFLLNSQDLRSLSRTLWAQLDPYLIEPYVEPETIAPSHLAEWIRGANVDGIIDVRS
jgi:hypothetical protein